jgi:hypothetical protein
MNATDTASRIAPYLEQLAENEYARENIRSGAENLRAAFERSQKRRVKTGRDEKLRRQVMAGAIALTEGGKALVGGREKPKKRWPKRLAVVLGLTAAGAAVAIAASEELRASLGISGSHAPEQAS